MSWHLAPDGGMFLTAMSDSPRLALGLALAGLFVAEVSAQGVRRPIGGRGSFGDGGGGIVVSPSDPKAPAPPRTVTYLSLTPEREWKSAAGQKITARLIAFDEGDAERHVPPTVVRDEQVRLLKGKKVFVYPLAKLDPAHRAEVRSIQSQLAASYEGRKKAPKE